MLQLRIVLKQLKIPSCILPNNCKLYFSIKSFYCIGMQVLKDKLFVCFYVILTESNEGDHKGTDPR